MDYLPAITCGVRDDPKYRNKRAAFVNAFNFATTANGGESTSQVGGLGYHRLSDVQLDLLKVLKRRSYPLAFKDDATNEDIVHAMSGQLAQTVFLRRDRTTHRYPAVRFEPEIIFC